MKRAPNGAPTTEFVFRMDQLRRFSSATITDDGIFRR